MEIPLLDSDDVPRPPQAVRFRSLSAEPYPDGSRVRLSLSLTPFVERPNIEIELRDHSGAGWASASVIENMDARLSLTLHLPQGSPQGDYRAVARLAYPDQGMVDTAETTFTLPRPPDGGG